MFAVSPVIYGITRISNSIMATIIQYRYITRKIAVFSHQQNRFWNIRNTEHVCNAMLDPNCEEIGSRTRHKDNQSNFLYLLVTFFFMMAYRGAKIANLKREGRREERKEWMDFFIYWNNRFSSRQISYRIIN